MPTNNGIIKAFWEELSIGRTCISQLLAIFMIDLSITFGL